MAARVILRIVGIMRCALCMKAVAQRMKKIARVAGRKRTVRCCRRVVTVFRSVAGAFIGASVVVVVVFVGIVRQHGSGVEAQQADGCEED